MNIISADEAKSIAAKFNMGVWTELYKLSCSPEREAPVDGKHYKRCEYCIAKHEILHCLKPELSSKDIKDLTKLSNWLSYKIKEIENVKP